MLSLFLTYYKSYQVQLHKWKADLIEFCFPSSCVGCAMVGSIICTDCIAKIALINEPICQQCSQKLDDPDQSCTNCAVHSIEPIYQIRAAGWFLPPLSQFIHHFKYHNLFALATPLSQLLIDQWSKWQNPVDLIIPIPLHPTRFAERGYNQSSLLAKNFGAAYQLPIIEDSLIRTKITTAQVGLNIKEREANLINAFSVSTNEIVGKKILLIDDVCTTGATLVTAANALMIAGANSVSAYCVARAI